MTKDSPVTGLIAFILGVLGTAAVIKIIDDITKEKKFICPACGTTLKKGIARCPQCQTQLRWA